MYANTSNTSTDSNDCQNGLLSVLIFMPSGFNVPGSGTYNLGKMKESALGSQEKEMGNSVCL